jgi:hypothetical protein
MQAFDYTDTLSGASSLSDATCEQCGQGFAKRASSGGSPQRFCSQKCRTAFHAQNPSIAQRSPACDAATPSPATPIAEPPRATQKAPKDVEDDFDWFTDDSIILRKQLPIAVYFNKQNELVIRQQSDDWPDDDVFIVIAPQNIGDFVDKLTDIIGIPSVGKP